MAISTGMTSAIVNPLNEGLVRSVRAADVLAFNDPNREPWIVNDREPQTEGATGGRRRGGGRCRA